MGAQIGGQTYGEMTAKTINGEKNDKAIDADTALVSSLANAAMQAPMEQFALEKALSVFKASGVWQAVKSIVGSAGTEFLTEWAQQYPDEIARIWAKTTQKGQGFEQGFKTFVDRLGEMTIEGMYQGAVAAPWGALFGGVGMVRNGKAPAQQLSPEMQQFFTQQAQESNAMLARQGLTVALDAAAQHVDNLETRRQGPEALTEMLGELLPENFKQTWLGPDDARTLYQDAQEKGQEAELLDALGTDAETVQQAVETGQPLPVDTAAVLAKAQPEARAQIMQAMRVTPDGASGAEAAQFDPAKRTEEALRRVVEGAESTNPNDPDAVLAQARSAQKLHAEVNKQTTRLVQQIEAATGYPRHVAKANAELLAQNALAMQAAYGFPADDILREITYTRAEHADQQEDAHYQLDDNGNAVSPGESSPRIAQVVSVDPSIIVDDNGKPVNLKNTSEVRDWILKKYSDVAVQIADDGTIQKFTATGLRASAKKRGNRQRQAYAALDNLLRNALYDKPEEVNQKHEKMNDGQLVYYSAANIGGDYYSVRFKLDKPLSKKELPAYKDHKVTEIEIAPSLYGIQSAMPNTQNEGATAKSSGASPSVGANLLAGSLGQEQAPSTAAPQQNTPAVSGISLSVLKCDVKPSRIEGGTLFQTAYHGSPYKFDKFTLEHIGGGEGAQAFGWGLYFAGKKSTAEFYRKVLTAPDKSISNSRKDELEDAAGDTLTDKEALNLHNRIKGFGSVDNVPPEIFQEALQEALNRKKNKGQTYKVDIPEDNHLLLWDLPLSAQPEEVKNALENGYSSDFKKIKYEDGEWRDTKGEEFYLSIISELRSDQAASEFLNSLGIKGIKYLDGDSRFDGEGSYNYVIFDDAAINILQTYYQHEGTSPLGSVTFTPQSAAVRIFPGANLSTIPHESAHIFFENLASQVA